jgi:hypothetical protein
MERDLTEGYFQYQQTDLDNENYRSLCHQTDNDVTNKNNDVSFEGLDEPTGLGMHVQLY